MLTPGLRLLLALLLLLGLPSCGLPGGTEWMWIGLIALLLFGGAKLPGLMKGLGSGIHEFKKGLKDGEGEDDDDAPPKELKGGDSKKGTE
jgi:sec-independent protein translocase protein TatA